MSEGHPDGSAPEHHLPQDHSHHGHGEEHDEQEDMNGKKRRRPDQRQHPTDYTDRRTLFIINLPRDVTARELYNMLYFMDGFCKVQLYEPAPKSTEASINTLSAFALFDSQAQAMAASTRLHGHTFDPAQYGTPISSTSGSTFVTPIATGSHILQVRLANKNLIMTKEERESVHKRARTDSTPSVPASGFGYGAAAGSMGMGHMAAYAASSNGGSNASPYYLPPTSAYGYAYPGAANFAYGASQAQAQAASVASASGAVPPGTLHLTPGPLPVSQHPPGTTLFLARMGAMSPPEILNLCVSACPHGFRDHKITTDRSGQRVAFVQYDTIENATAALSRLHGYQGTVGAFSKNPLGVKGSSQGSGQQAQAYQGYPSHY